MLRLRAAQVIDQQKALHRIGTSCSSSQRFGALDVASHINGHADRSSYQKFLELPLILLSVSRFFSKRNSFSAAILSVLRISCKKSNKMRDKFLHAPGTVFPLFSQSPVFPKNAPPTESGRAHKYSQKFFSERKRVQTAKNGTADHLEERASFEPAWRKGPAEQFHQAVSSTLLFQFPNCVMTVSNIGTSP